MSHSLTNTKIEIIHPLPKHFAAIQELCLKVYPFSKPWTIPQLESHRYYFPDGQLVAIDTESDKVVGLAFSLIISWDDYSHYDSWTDFTTGGFFRNHNPSKGKTLYGAEVMVDPQMRGRGVGKLLYKGRQEIVEKYNLNRIRAGARLRGYCKFKEKYSPNDYVIEVIKGNIYDPTLSFQLKQGFVVLGVAKNYLFNDPESLGYAAVIEWLNPKKASPRQLSKQQSSVTAFLSNKRFVPELLPHELNRLVRKAAVALGKIVKESEGSDFYNKIEQYRNALKTMRLSTTPKELSRVSEKIEKETPSDQLKIAHAFALHLELVNACETAYRTWRQRQKPIAQGLKKRIPLRFVLTSHPAQARSPAVTELLQSVSNLLIESLHNNFVSNEHELMSLIRLLWKLPLPNGRPQTVENEAKFIFSIIFSERIFDSLLERQPGYDLKILTWAGGDRVEHPDLDAAMMVKCLSLSRSRILEILGEKLRLVLRDIQRFDPGSEQQKRREKFLQSLASELNPLRTLSSNDGNRVKKWTLKLRRFLSSEKPLITKHHQILNIERMLSMFPALVVPLELREDAKELAGSLIFKNSPIRKMISELAKIAGTLNVVFYVRGLVVSNCETHSDLENACKLTSAVLRTKSFPITPQFETKTALLLAHKTIKRWFETRTHLELVKRHWNGRFEIMLGYFDASKALGLFPAYNLIKKSAFDLENLLVSQGIKPVFFHGSGLGIGRGGGSLKEQVSWWPNSAKEQPKLTFQGEMIQRVFATKEILNSQCVHLSNTTIHRRTSKGKPRQSPAREVFAAKTETEYQKFISNVSLMQNLYEASPLKYLAAKSWPRQQTASQENFIELASSTDWVLSCTQTRSLLATWWGVGSAWLNLSSEHKEQLKVEFEKNTFFATFVKNLGFTLAKVNLDIWKMYFRNSSNQETLEVVENEYKLAVEFVASLSNKKSLVWFRPWLEESIRLRAPHIHMLNILQIQAMKSKNKSLMTETLVGISSGMLTTG